MTPEFRELKVSQLIVELQKALVNHGDLPVRTLVNDEGSVYAYADIFCPVYNKDKIIVIEGY